MVSLILSTLFLLLLVLALSPAPPVSATAVFDLDGNEVKNGEYYILVINPIGRSFSINVFPANNLKSCYLYIIPNVNGQKAIPVKIKSNTTLEYIQMFEPLQLSFQYGPANETLQWQVIDNKITKQQYVVAAYPEITTSYEFILADFKGGKEAYSIKYNTGSNSVAVGVLQTDIVLGITDSVAPFGFIKYAPPAPPIAAYA